MVEKLWNDKDSKDNTIALRSLLILFGIKYLAQCMRFLTKYPPFSFFWKDRFFHYENSDVYDARKKIRELAADIGGWFDVSAVDRDRYFLTLRGKFTGLKRNGPDNLEKISERLAEEDMLLRVRKPGTVDILVKSPNQGA